jgi:hypothetical protein
MADVLYHSMVLLTSQGVKFEEVLEILRARFAKSGMEEAYFTIWSTLVFSPFFIPSQDSVVQGAFLMTMLANSLWKTVCELPLDVALHIAPCVKLGLSSHLLIDSDAKLIIPFTSLGRSAKLLTPRFQSMPSFRSGHGLTRSAIHGLLAGSLQAVILCFYLSVRRKNTYASASLVGLLRSKNRLFWVSRQEKGWVETAVHNFCSIVALAAICEPVLICCKSAGDRHFIGLLCRQMRDFAMPRSFTYT